MENMEYHAYRDASSVKQESRHFSDERFKDFSLQQLYAYDNKIRKRGIDMTREEKEDRKLELFDNINNHFSELCNTKCNTKFHVINIRNSYQTLIWQDIF